MKRFLLLALASLVLSASVASQEKRDLKWWGGPLKATLTCVDNAAGEPRAQMTLRLENHSDAALEIRAIDLQLSEDHESFAYTPRERNRPLLIQLSSKESTERVLQLGSFELLTFENDNQNALDLASRVPPDKLQIIIGIHYFSTHFSPEGSEAMKTARCGPWP